MLNSIKGMFLTLVSSAKGLREPVTQQYPATGNLFRREEAPTPVQERFMGFPALTWDEEVDEPYCTSCMSASGTAPRSACRRRCRTTPCTPRERAHAARLSRASR